MIMSKLKVGQRIDVYEVLANTRYYDITIGRQYASRSLDGRDNFVVINNDRGDETYHVHTQIGDIPPECRKVGTMVIKKVK